MRRDIRLLVALAITGVAALAWEVLWSRALIPWVGGTAMAQVMTVAVYMFGLFLGASLGMPVSRRTEQPRRWFFRAELAAALITSAAILGLPLANPLFALLAQGSLLSGDLGGALRGLAGGLLILPGTILMGFSFPMALAALQQRTPDRGTAALAYGVNTLGATLGTCLGGFILVPELGVVPGTVAVLLLDLLVLAWAFRAPAKVAAAPAPVRPARRTPELAPESPAGGSEAAWLLSVLIGGAVSLGLEVTLFRILGMLVGPTARAFTLVLASYVFGLGVGSLAVQRIVARSGVSARRVFVSCWLLVGVLGSLLYFVIALWPEVMVHPSHAGDTDLAGRFVRQLWMAAAVLVPFTLLFGASYPAAVAADGRGQADRAARYYAVLTLGNILGLLVAAIFLLPRLPLETVLLLHFAAAFLAALPVWSQAGATPLQRSVRVAVPLLAVALLLGFRRPWNWLVLNSAPYLYADEGSDTGHEFLLFFKTGFETTVAVTKEGDELNFTLDGKTDGSNSPEDQITQSFLGILPTLLHPAPRNALVIGLGTGQTSAEILRFPVERVVCAELSDAVVDALPYFDEINRRLWEDPRHEILKTDGRTVFRYGEERFDLIVSEPSNVWVPGVAHLFTHETFVEARERLREGGIFCQWLHAYRLDSEAFRTVVRTLLDVFPTVTFWTTGMLSPEALFVCSVEPIELSLEGLRRRLDEVEVPNHAVTGERLTAESFLRHYVAGPERLRRYAGPGAMTVDSLPSLEYAAEKSMQSGDETGFHALLVELLETPAALLPAGDAASLQRLAAGVEANRQLQALLFEGGEASLPKLDALAAHHPADRELHAAVGRTFTGVGFRAWRDGDLETAGVWFEKALHWDPKNSRALQYLVGIQQGLGNYPKAYQLIDRLEACYDRRGVLPQVGRAQLLSSQGKFVEALALYRVAYERDPASLLSLVGLATCHASLGDRQAARDALDLALELAPFHPMLRQYQEQLERISTGVR